LFKQPGALQQRILLNYMSTSHSGEGFNDIGTTVYLGYVLFRAFAAQLKFH